MPANAIYESECRHYRVHGDFIHVADVLCGDIIIIWLISLQFRFLNHPASTTKASTETKMDYKAALVNGIDSDSQSNSDAVTSHIKHVPVTLQRKPFIQPEGDVRLSHTGKSPRDEQK
jgi:hypothetical protein